MFRTEKVFLLIFQFRLQVLEILSYANLIKGRKLRNIKIMRTLVSLNFLYITVRLVGFIIKNKTLRLYCLRVSCVELILFFCEESII